MGCQPIDWPAATIALSVNLLANFSDCLIEAVADGPKLIEFADLEYFLFLIGNIAHRKFALAWLQSLPDLQEHGDEIGAEIVRIAKINDDIVNRLIFHLPQHGFHLRGQRFKQVIRKIGNRTNDEEIVVLIDFKNVRLRRFHQ